MSYAEEEQQQCFKKDDFAPPLKKKNKTTTAIQKRTIRMSAATEASLDDIVHSYGGIRVIKMTGDNTPSHMIDAYKELLNMRRPRGEFDE